MIDCKVENSVDVIYQVIMKHALSAKVCSKDALGGHQMQVRFR